jgi:hypothetical protein
VEFFANRSTQKIHHLAMVATKRVLAKSILVGCVSRSHALRRGDDDKAQSTEIADWKNSRDREHTRTKRSYKTIHHLAMVASAPLTASKREGVSPFMGLIWTH